MSGLGMFDPSAMADVQGNRSGLRDPETPPQPVALPPTFHPPRAARLWLVQLAGAAGATVVAAPAAPLASLSDDFGADPDLSTHWPRDYVFGGSDLANWDGAELSWFSYTGDPAGSGSGRGSAAPFDASGALAALDLVQIDQGTTFAVSYEDRANNVQVHFSVRRTNAGDAPGADRLALRVWATRTEGATVEIAASVLGVPYGVAAARRIRTGFNADGTGRVELLTSPTGSPDIWVGLTSVVLPADVAAVFNIGRVYLHIDGRVLGYTGIKVAHLRGSRPVGPIAAPADLPQLVTALLPPLGSPAGRHAYIVPNGLRGVLDRVALTLFVLAPAAGDATPHAVADCWARVLVDGVPVQGLSQLRPSALGVAQALPAGVVLATVVKPSLELRGGQTVAAELVVRDSTAGHPVELTLSGWTWEEGSING